MRHFHDKAIFPAPVIGMELSGFGGEDLWVLELDFMLPVKCVLCHC